jgi:coenzyme PQQ precursor peptide PqqA
VGPPAAPQQCTGWLRRERFHWRSFPQSVLYRHGRKYVPARRAKMAWKAPKIVEVPCGMEINMYVSATRK